MFAGTQCPKQERKGIQTTISVDLFEMATHGNGEVAGCTAPRMHLCDPETKRISSGASVFASKGLFYKTRGGWVFASKDPLQDLQGREANNTPGPPKKTRASSLGRISVGKIGAPRVRKSHAPLSLSFLAPPWRSVHSSHFLAIKTRSDKG